MRPLVLILLRSFHSCLRRRDREKKATKSTKAKSMSFAGLIPDWNSLDSVRHTHNELEAIALLFFALLVVLDVTAHLSEEGKKKMLLEKFALGFFAIAVLSEIVAYPYGQRNDTLSEQIIGSLDTKAREASANASGALTKSGSAEIKADKAEEKSVKALTRSQAAEDSLAQAEGDAGKAQAAAANALATATDAANKAGKAEASLGKAESEAKSAENSASNAFTIADGARKEADTFEADIVLAKKQATDAESHLADALKQAANAEAELYRLKTPRSLIHVDELIDALKPFNGTEYALNTFMDNESSEFTKLVASALDASGWVRKQPTKLQLGIPTIEIFLGRTAERVPACLDTGFGIHMHAKESLAILQSLPNNLLPKSVQAAVALKSAIGPSISPTNERNVDEGIIDQRPEENTPLVVCVGKKP